MGDTPHGQINLDQLPLVVPLWPTAGTAWGLSRSRTYSLAARGEFPCRIVRLGRRRCVLSAELRASLGLAAEIPHPVPGVEQAPVDVPVGMLGDGGGA